MAVDTLDIAALPARSRTAACAVDDKSRRDYAVFCNSLLLLTDFACLLVAAYVATKVHALQFAGAVFNGTRWDAPYIAATIAILAAIVLYDRRFISVASRGHTGALIRCYLTGFTLFTCGVAVIGAASGAVHAIPASIIAVWWIASFVLTALLRVVEAAAVRVCARKGMLAEAIAIVGAGPRAERLVRYLKQTQPITSELLGVFDDEVAPSLGAVANNGWIAGSPGAVTGNIESLIELGKVRRIDWIFLALPSSDEERLLSVVNRLKALSVPIGMCPRNLAEDTQYRPVDFIGNGVPVTLLQRSVPSWRAKLKVIGQFLPRWVTTLLLLSTLLIRKLWSVLRILTTPRRKPEDRGAEKLLCELDDYDLDGFMQAAHDFGQHRLGYVVTPNADHILRLHDDVAFRKSYSLASYVLLDSRFLAHLLHATTGIRFPVCTGSDVTARLFKSMAPTDRVMIIGSNTAQVDLLRQRFGLKNISHHNPPMGFIHDEAAVEACLQFIEAHSPFRYCVLAFGTPQQEILVERLQARGVARGLVFCVGASINFLTGVEQRAPRWMQKLGLEWLYRLARNPKRLAHRYLVRGPRIFSLLRKTKFVLRSRPKQEIAARAA